MNFQRARRMFVGCIATLAICVGVVGCGYSQPDDAFLKSDWHIVHLNTPGMGTVADFVETVKKAQMNNGKRFEVLGWKKSDNVYTLHVQAAKEIEIRFTHILSSPSNGAESTLDAVTFGGDPINPAEFAVQIMAFR